jgi:hypothetical protein
MWTAVNKTQIWLFKMDTTEYLYHRGYTVAWMEEARNPCTLSEESFWIVVHLEDW